MPTTQELLPWSWSITASDPSVCPSSTAILGTFAAVNAIVSLASAITGHRLVVRFITFGFFGKKDNSKSWMFLWIIPFSLQLGANAGIATLMRHATGYTTTFSTGQLVVFYTARPRLSWIVIGSLSFWRRKATGSSYELPSYWQNAALSQVVAELILELIAMSVMGTTVHFASHHGYYIVGSAAYKSIPEAAHLMYAGAIWYLLGVTISFLFFFPLLLSWGLVRRRRSGPDFGQQMFGPENTVDLPKRDGSYPNVFEQGVSPTLRGGGDSEYSEGSPTSSIQTAIVSIMLILGLLCTWVSAWLFWAGFLEVAGDLYCPPKLTQQGAIWVGTSIVGVMLGTGT